MLQLCFSLQSLLQSVTTETLPQLYTFSHHHKHLYRKCQLIKTTTTTRGVEEKERRIVFIFIFLRIFFIYNFSCFFFTFLFLVRRAHKQLYI